MDNVRRHFVEQRNSSDGNKEIGLLATDKKTDVNLANIFETEIFTTLYVQGLSESCLKWYSENIPLLLKKYDTEKPDYGDNNPVEGQENVCNNSSMKTSISSCETVLPWSISGSLIKFDKSTLGMLFSVRNKIIETKDGAKKVASDFQDKVNLNFKSLFHTFFLRCCLGGSPSKEYKESIMRLSCEHVFKATALQKLSAELFFNVVTEFELFMNGPEGLPKATQTILQTLRETRDYRMAENYLKGNILASAYNKALSGELAVPPVHWSMNLRLKASKFTTVYVYNI